MRVDVDQVVDLHQVHPGHAHPPHGLAHGEVTFLASGRPYLGGHEQLIADAQVAGEIADDLFRRSVHRRRIHQAPAELHELIEDRLWPEPARLRSCNIECLPGAEPYDGDRFTGRWDWP